MTYVRAAQGFDLFDRLGGMCMVIPARREKEST